MMQKSSVLFLVVLRLQTSVFRPISQITKRSDRKVAHPPLLIGGEGLIERLPRFGELLEVCCFLRQCISAFVQKFNRIAVAQDFYTTFATQFIRLFLQVCETGLPVPRPRANSVLHSWPQFFLISCQLQRGLNDINPRTRHGGHIGFACFFARCLITSGGVRSPYLQPAIRIRCRTSK